MKSQIESIRSAVSRYSPILFLALITLAGCTKRLPDDGKDAEMMRFDNLNNYRYCEVFMIGGNPITKDLKANFYNTTDRNGGAQTHDSCSDQIWATVDPEAIKEEYDVLAIFKNGPRYWLYDWLELPVGVERKFGATTARWMGSVNLPKDFGKEGSTFFKTTQVHRKSKQGYNGGTRVFILDDPEGTVWIMQAYSRIVDAGLNYDDLMTLDQKIDLPDGWKYRTVVLDRALTIGAINGQARVTQDNLENTYNALFEMDGQTNYTFIP